MKPDPIRPTDDARALARALLDAMRHASLGTHRTETGYAASGHPNRGAGGSRWHAAGAAVGLAAHSRSLAADPRPAADRGRTGKGDAMTHARLSLMGARFRLPRTTGTPGAAGRCATPRPASISTCPISASGGSSWSRAC